MTTVTLYGRKDCCLCDDARDVLKRAQATHAFVLEELDIETDERLLRTYLEKIPVVAIDGVERFELIVDATELKRLLCRVQVQ